MFGFEFLPHSLEADTACIKQMIARAALHLGVKTDFILIPANPRNQPSVDSILASYALRQIESSVEFVPTISGALSSSAANSGGVKSHSPTYSNQASKGMVNKAQILSQMLAVKYAGFSSLALIGGDGGDGVQMLQLAREVLGDRICLISGTPAHKSAIPRLKAKLTAGANVLITQPIFCIDEARLFAREFEPLGRQYQAKLYFNVFGVFSVHTALSINSAHLGFKIPKAYVDSMCESCNGGFEGRASFERLWADMRTLAFECGAHLYLSTPKHNDLRAFGQWEK
ncbi:hypothetical protein LS71_000850 [Helicobacter jaachi]|uniref:Methylenetetrahydrofolate reductase n=1 Tax=Helicobacter jaachi TaxID=1677920 RepID=A0A4U8TBM6_9HELI|nr:hypothetical protein [Helicobacter jaachi]TLD97336.1 hypothetical protein LS71_000850 [Helicobacter jaachi]